MRRGNSTSPRTTPGKLFFWEGELQADRPSLFRLFLASLQDAGAFSVSCHVTDVMCLHCL